MKRLLTLAVSFLCCMATTFAQFSGSGSGTESDPYVILNPIQLNQLRNFLNMDGVYFKLMADIDLTEFLEDENPSEGWQPIGTKSSPFLGILDGNGKTISGLWISRPNMDYVGFFGCLYDSKNSGLVKNLTLKGSTIKGNDYVGFLSGSDGNIIDCTFEGSVRGASHVGGCTGKNAIFTRVTAEFDVKGTGDYVGGFSGEGGSFTECTLMSNGVSGKDYVGGFSGKNGDFISCSLTSNYVQGDNNIGGLCGAEDSEKSIRDCFVHTNTHGINYVGGICGKSIRDGHNNATNISKCGFSGDVSGDSYVGGICGEYTGRATIYGCFAVGHISARGNYVGGIIGFSSSYPARSMNNHQLYFNDLINSYF